MATLAVNELYFETLLSTLLETHGPLPIRLDATDLTKANVVAHRVSGRDRIVQLKDISYSFDRFLGKRDMMIMVPRNGTWIIQKKVFERDLVFQPPTRRIEVDRRVSLLSDYLGGGTKPTGNETLSLYNLYIAGAFEEFYGEKVDFIASTGRTRTGKIPLELEAGIVTDTESIQIESDGAIVFMKDNKKHYSAIEAKESVQPMWWRQLFYPYWNDVIRHPDAECFITLVQRVAKTNDYHFYCLKFTSALPTSVVVLDSAIITLIG